MNTTSLQIYYDALERLKKNKSIILSKGTKITNDAVSLEAGRKKGSIKKSRIMFADLIKDIRIAREQQTSEISSEQEKLAKASNDIDKIKIQYDKLLEQQFSIYLENMLLKRKMKKIRQKAAV